MQTYSYAYLFMKAFGSVFFCDGLYIIYDILNFKFFSMVDDLFKSTSISSTDKRLTMDFQTGACRTVQLSKQTRGCQGKKGFYVDKTLCMTMI